MRIKKSDTIILILILIIFISFIEIKYFSIKSENILMNYAKNKLNYIINNIINESINTKIHGLKYNDIIVVEKDKNDNIVSIDFDNEIVNNILFLTTNEILNEIKLIETNKFNELNLKNITEKEKVYYVPYGVIYNNNILNNLGPKVPFKIVLIGSTNNNTKINVEEYGINSSKVEVVLNISLKMQIILPFNSQNIDIDKSIILDSKIIQGTVPNYYGGIFSTN